MHFKHTLNPFQIKKITIFLFLLFFFYGCSIKEKTELLPQNIAEQWLMSLGHSDLPVTSSLLQLFKNEKLNRLVDEALKNNHDLKATALRLEASEMLHKSTFSRSIPSANISFLKGRNNQNMDSVTGEKFEKNHYRATFNLNWELDIWGKLADERHAAKARQEVKRIEYIGAYDSLAARVIQSWIGVIAAQQYLKIQKQKINTSKKIEQTILRRYRKGLGNLDELSVARYRTMLEKADISQLKENYKKEIRYLELLLGRYPLSNEIKGGIMPAIATPSWSTPLNILNKRPDIRAALAGIEADKLTASASKKNMLPSLNLSYEAFKQAGSLSSLRGKDVLWDLIGNIIQPLFEGNRLKFEAKAAQIQEDASIEDLMELVLKAIKEVEDRSDIEDDLRFREVILSDALKESKKSTFYYRNRYKNGLETLQGLLLAIEQEFSIKEQLIDIKSARLINRIDLALALGIGY